MGPMMLCLRPNYTEDQTLVVGSQTWDDRDGHQANFPLPSSKPNCDLRLCEGQANFLYGELEGIKISIYDKKSYNQPNSNYNQPI